MEVGQWIKSSESSQETQESEDTETPAKRISKEEFIHQLRN